MRVLFVALFMVLATHVGAQEAQGVAAEAPSQQEGKDGKANDTQPRANEPSIPVRIIESPEETQRTRDREAASDNHESDDLKAQQKAADAADRAATAAERQVVTAWWQVGVGIVGIAALVATIWLSVRSTNAAVRSANLAERVFTDIERPWVVIDINSVGAALANAMPISIVNHGRSPAFVGIIQMDCFAQSDLPSQFIPVNDHGEKGLQNILPPQGKGIDLEWRLDKFADKIETTRTGTQPFYFMAVISYRDGGGNWYATGIARAYDKRLGFVGAGDDTHNFMS